MLLDLRGAAVQGQQAGIEAMCTIEKARYRAHASVALAATMAAAVAAKAAAV